MIPFLYNFRFFVNKHLRNLKPSKTTQQVKAEIEEMSQQPNSPEEVEKLSLKFGTLYCIDAYARYSVYLTQKYISFLGVENLSLKELSNSVDHEVYTQFIVIVLKSCFAIEKDFDAKVINSQGAKLDDSAKVILIENFLADNRELVISHVRKILTCKNNMAASLVEGLNQIMNHGTKSVNESYKKFMNDVNASGCIMELNDQWKQESTWKEVGEDYDSEALKNKLEILKFFKQEHSCAASLLELVEYDENLTYYFTPIWSEAHDVGNTPTLSKPQSLPGELAWEGNEENL